MAMITVTVPRLPGRPPQVPDVPPDAQPVEHRVVEPRLGAEGQGRQPGRLLHERRRRPFRKGRRN